MYEPLHRHRPPHRWTNGDLAAKVGADLGLPPDDEQAWLLDTIFAERSADMPASFEVCVISPRQNIKTSTLGVAALADLFVFGVERHLWTAHHGDTLKGTFQDFRAWIKSNPEYDDQVTFYEGHQDMSIVHKETGGVIDFQSRSGKAGRGLTGVKRITLDEALFLEPKHMGAIYPTMLTRPGAQVRIGSSAGLETSEQLRKIRERGRAGKDKRLAYVEYGAKVTHCLHSDCPHTVGAEGCALDDRDLWWQANCAMWAGRVAEESLEDQRASMPPDEFRREFLSWWEDPVSVGGALPYQPWISLRDPDTERGTSPSFGVQLVDERIVWVAVAWTRADGMPQVMLTNDGRPIPAHRAVEECERLRNEWGGTVVTSAFGDELEKAGVDALVMSASDFAEACGLLADSIHAGTVRHGNQRALNQAVKAAKWRPELASGEKAFQLKDSPETGPAAAAARALWGIENSAPLPAIY